MTGLQPLPCGKSGIDQERFHLQHHKASILEGNLVWNRRPKSSQQEKLGRFYSQYCFNSREMNVKRKRRRPIPWQHLYWVDLFFGSCVKAQRVWTRFETQTPKQVRQFRVWSLCLLPASPQSANGGQTQTRQTKWKSQELRRISWSLHRRSFQLANHGSDDLIRINSHLGIWF